MSIGAVAWFNIRRWAQSAKMRLWTNSESVAGIRRFSSQLWLLLLIHTLFNERGFAVSVSFSLYVRRVFAVSSDQEVALYYVIWRLCEHILKIASGFVVETMGLRRSLIFGAFVMTIGQILYTFSNYLWLTLGSLFWLITLGSVFFEQAADLLPQYYFPDEPTTMIVFAAMYASMNLGALISLCISYYALDYVDGWAGYRLIMTAAAMLSVIGCLSTQFYETPKLLEQARDSRARPKCSAIFTIFAERRFWQLFLLLLSMTGVWSIYRFMELMLIIYLVRVAPGVSYAPLLGINTVLIIPLVSIFGVLTSRRLTPYTWIVIGAAIAATSVTWLWLLPGSPVLPTALMMIQVTIGEAIAAPKIQQWVAVYSPEGTKAIYKGWLKLADAPGIFLAGAVSATLLSNYAPEQTLTLDASFEEFLTNARIMWAWVLLIALSSVVMLLTLRNLIIYEPKPDTSGVELEAIVEPLATSPLEDETQ